MPAGLKQSAGILLYRHGAGGLEVFLVHPGGPFWAKKHEGSWTVPKGEFEPPEDALAAARREFEEETGFVAEGPFVDLQQIVQKSGKTVLAWACEGDCDPAALRSNTCTIAWPPRSGRSMVIPEVDRGEWFTPEAAQAVLRREQWPFLERLQASMGQR